MAHKPVYKFDVLVRAEVDSDRVSCLYTQGTQFVFFWESLAGQLIKLRNWVADYGVLEEAVM